MSLQIALLLQRALVGFLQKVYASPVASQLLQGCTSDCRAPCSCAIEEESTRILRSLDDIDFRLVVLILLGAMLINMLWARLLPWVAEQLPTRFRLYILPLVPILRVLILIVVVLSIFPLIINTNRENVFAILGAIGVAIGFAFKDYVSSIIAGIVVLYERPYQSGDWVRIGDDYGEVRSVGLRSLRIVTPADDTITIPHLRIWTDNINSANSGAPQHMCIAHFYLHPEHDAQRVRQRLFDVAHTSAYVDLHRRVAVIVQENAWGTHYQLKAYPVDGREQFEFISDMTVRGKSILAALDVQPAAAAASVAALE